MPAERCVVIEDSLPGLAAARAAGTPLRHAHHLARGGCLAARRRGLARLRRPGAARPPWAHA